MDSKVREQVRASLIEYAHTDPGCDKNDVLFEIGKIYGVSMEELEQSESSKNDQKEKPPVVSFDFMREFIEDVFKSYGVSEDHAKVAADVLVEADMRGIDSHGLGRLKPIYCDRFDQGILFPDMPIDIVKETDTTALVNANLGLGLYVGPYCMQLAIDKAKRHGVGFVVVRNSTHYGIAGYYTGMAADQGCVGFTGTNARPSIAPTFGAESVLGTNPICFGMPSSDPFPFNIDCASSITQRGTIERYAREGKTTPRGCVLDIQGIERTDTEGILVDLVKRTCFLTPIGGAGEALGGYKGYGWATTIELLCTAFQSGPIGEELSGIDKETGQPKPMPLGHFFLAIDIEPLCALDEFKENVGRLLKTLRNVKKLPGHDRIWTAGEKECKSIKMFSVGYPLAMRNSHKFFPFIV
jgi:LDH2 family malate/lactate/ureidoglycolate dehydrogenase